MTLDPAIDHAHDIDPVHDLAYEPVHDTEEKPDQDPGLEYKPDRDQDHGLRAGDPDHDPDLDFTPDQDSAHALDQDQDPVHDLTHDPE